MTEILSVTCTSRELIFALWELNFANFASLADFAEISLRENYRKTVDSCNSQNLIPANILIFEPRKPIINSRKTYTFTHAPRCKLDIWKKENKCLWALTLISFIYLWSNTFLFDLIRKNPVAGEISFWQKDILQIFSRKLVLVNINSRKVGLSPSKIVGFISLNESPLNAFY